MSRIKGKVAFIAGGSGTWGNELTSQLIDLGIRKVIIFSRGEITQVSMRRRFESLPVEFIVGDVRDFSAILYSMKGADYVFNLAALKHIGICEEQPQEAIKTNIDGMINLIKAAIHLKVEKFMMASTDKAIYPTCLYGMTKGVGERLVIQANNLTKDTDFFCIRSGNILGSSGSVLPLFIKMAKEKKVIRVTDFSMTRFFLPVREVVKLVIEGIETAHGGEIFIPEMPSFYIQDLAEVIAECYGNETTQIVETGSRVGEKLHELLIADQEAPNTYKRDGYFVINPLMDIDRVPISFLPSDKIDFKHFSSNDYLKSKEYLREMLLTNNYISYDDKE